MTFDRFKRLLGFNYASNPPETIYVKLLDEGVEVYRPVQARMIEYKVYLILPQAVPAGEKWEFKPGQIVYTVYKSNTSYSLIAINEALKVFDIMKWAFVLILLTWAFLLWLYHWTDVNYFSRGCAPRRWGRVECTPEAVNFVSSFHLVGFSLFSVLIAFLFVGYFFSRSRVKRVYREVALGKISGQQSPPQR